MSKIKRILAVIFEKKEVMVKSIDESHKSKEEVIPNKKNKENYLTVTELSKYFHLTPNELNNIFQKLNWSNKENRWLLMTRLGEYYGAKECYDNRTKTKYLKWHKSVKNSTQLLKAIEEFKKTKLEEREVTMAEY
ncbi:MAG: Unknown protein [uncultured Sulfurovum sp.]|uniref:Uncharacterized protein n=1 Tax=uncultured Sulfurovum sp. TaxID=269237 RepID=A0A6S6RSP5_9BACT|nr:MAG: Unknown protein [uncultured Sulfurovum sp.]